MRYEHSQTGWFVIPVLAFFTVVAFIVASDEQVQVVAVVTIIVIMVAVLVLGVALSRLDVTVTDDQVVAAFGFGKPRRAFDLADIKEVRAVRNSWWNGWGVRRIRNGWMYNVWGLDAVQLELRSGTSFRIGTDDPDGLEAALTGR
jgi:hypothetical protein